MSANHRNKLSSEQWAIRTLFLRQLCMKRITTPLLPATSGRGMMSLAFRKTFEVDLWLVRRKLRDSGSQALGEITIHDIAPKQQQHYVAFPLKSTDSMFNNERTKTSPIANAHLPSRFIQDVKYFFGSFSTSLKLRDSSCFRVNYVLKRIADDIIDPKLQLTAAFPLIVLVMQWWVRELTLGP